MKVWLSERMTYWRAAMKHAYRPTRDLVIDVVILLATFVYNDYRAYVSTGNRSMADLVSTATFYSSIVPTLGALAIIGMFRILFVAPFRLNKESRATISSLTWAVDRLKEAQRPKLSIVRTGIRRPWLQIQPWMRSEGGVLHTYRIGLINEGQEPIIAVDVRLEELIPQPHDLLAVPCQLQFMNHEQHDIPMTLDPVYVDVLCFVISSRGTHHMWIPHIVETANKAIPTDNYDLRLSVRSKNGGMYFSEWWRITLADPIPTLEFIRRA